MSGRLDSTVSVFCVGVGLSAAMPVVAASIGGSAAVVSMATIAPVVGTAAGSFVGTIARNTKAGVGCLTAITGGVVAATSCAHPAAAGALFGSFGLTFGALGCAGLAFREVSKMVENCFGDAPKDTSTKKVSANTMSINMQPPAATPFLNKNAATATATAADADADSGTELPH